ncbi:uncharacterized protein LOC132204442 [Neocloeon triangulifer]|uniref:uncharacterized protein LOC132204442 n=1 Tax=Neocloeon triangulifer TaxID=2078957 RepID=UPI00286EF819|nr:uncharacterized protein LOC132204442 [Neocloeon triangulifer]
MGKKVNLVIGDETLTEDVDFLCEISHYFQAMFQDNFQESQMDSIDLTSSCDNFTTFFLKEVKKGREEKLELYVIVYRIMTPEIFQTLKMLMIKVDLEEIAMVTMSMAQLEEYRKIAADTGNEVLEKHCLKKACGFFSEFIDTLGFAMLSIEKLKMVLNSKYLDCESEIEVLRGVFRWFDHDIGGREEHFKTVLSLINWTKIKDNRDQFHFLMHTSNVVRESKKLEKLVSDNVCKATYEAMERRNTAHLPNVICGQQERQPIFLTVQNEFTYNKNQYAAMFFFDLENSLFMDNLVCEQKEESMDCEHDFDVHGFKVYLFGRLNRIEDKGLIRTRPICIPANWSTKTGFTSTCEVDLDEKAAGERGPFETDKKFQEHPIDAQRSGGNFYIFNIGCDRYNIKNDSVQTLWKSDGGYTSWVNFPFIYSALYKMETDLELFEFDLRNFTKTTIKSEYQSYLAKVKLQSQITYDCMGFPVFPFVIPEYEQESPPLIPPPIPPPHLRSFISGHRFLTPIDGTFYISEKMSTTFNDLKRISNENFHVEEELIQSGKMIVHQFSHGNDLYFLLHEGAEFSLGLYKFLGREVGLQKIKDLPNMAVQMKGLLSKHLRLNKEEIELSYFIKFKTVNPLWVEGFKYRSSMTTPAVPMETD